jgi:hypothetical protein
MSRVPGIEGRATEARVVVGYDGSDAARRAVAQGVRAAGPSGQVILVTVEPKMHADGVVAEPFVEPGDEPSQLLADARALAALTCAAGTTDVRTVARKATRRTKSWRLREPPTPTLSSSDVPASTFSLARSSAQWPFASSSSRTATSLSSPEEKAPRDEPNLPTAKLGGSGAVGYLMLRHNSTVGLVDRAEWAGLITRGQEAGTCAIRLGSC